MSNRWGGDGGVSARDGLSGPTPPSKSARRGPWGSGVAAEFLDHAGFAGEAVEGGLGLGGGGEAEFDEEDVLPGMAGDGAGFDAGEIDAGGGQVSEGGDERAGAVLQAEGYAELVGGVRGGGVFVGAEWGVGDAAEEMEAGVVFGVVFDVGGEDVRVVGGGGERGGDGGGVAEGLGFVAEGFRDDVLDGAGGVVKRRGAELRVGAEEVLALGERDGMREDLAEVGEGDAGGGDEVVVDVEERLAVDADGVGEEEVVVLGDGAVESVFDGEDGGVRGLVFEGLEDVEGVGAGEDVDGAGGVVEELKCGEVGVGAALALDGDAEVSGMWRGLWGMQRGGLWSDSSARGQCGPCARGEIEDIANLGDNLARRRGNLLERTPGHPGQAVPDSQGAANIRRSPMLWTITVILVILWLIGFIGFPTLGSWVHLLLVLAIIVLIFNLLSGRRGI